MSDVAKLKKAAAKAADACAIAHDNMTQAIEAWGNARHAFGVANEAVEQAEAFATALELRGKKAAE